MGLLKQILTDWQKTSGGVGFRIADNIAMKSGLDRNSDFRIRAGILYVLTLATASGHIYLPNEELYRHCIEFLGVSVEQLMHVQEEMEYDKSLMRDGRKGLSAIFVLWQK